jgi:hypothetical protein
MTALFLESPVTENSFSYKYFLISMAVVFAISIVFLIMAKIKPYFFSKYHKLFVFIVMSYCIMMFLWFVLTSIRFF